MRKLSAYGPSLVVLATALLVLFAGPSAVQRLTYEQTRTQIHQARHNLGQNSILEELNQAYRDIARIVEPSVVHISAQSVVENDFGRQRIAVSSGSGWIYDSAGHVVTNYHVVENTQRIEVQLHDGTLRPAELVGSDQFTDIAVLKIPEGRLHAAECAAEDDPVLQGDLVFAFGSPFDFRFSMSSGVVSGQGRSVGVIRGNFGQTGYENFIQVDAAINPGNSGGPLTDFRGRVIGMNTAIATRRSGSSFEEGQFAGIGLAIPVEMIHPVVTQLIETGVVAKGYLGVQAVDVTADLAVELQKRGFVGQGVYVTVLQPDGPALDAGIRLNDVITHVNDGAVTSMDQLRSIISSMLPGELAKLSLWRAPEPGQDAGRTLTVTVELAQLRVPGLSGGPTDSLPGLGIQLMSTCTRELAEEYSLEFHRGVMLEEIFRGSGFARAGFMPGSIIVAVMDRPVTTTDEFLANLERYDLRRGVELSMIDHNGDARPFMLTVR